MRVWVVGGDTGIGEDIVTRLGTMGEVRYVYSSGRGSDVRRIDELYKAYEERGPFDVVIYTAGVPYIDWIENLNQMRVMDTFNVNVIGFINLMTVLSNRQLGGRVIAIVSDASKRPMRGSLPYCASKAALRMAIQCAARELAPDWQIMGVSPGVVDGTKMTEFIDERVPEFRGWTSEKAREYERAGQPMGRRCLKAEVSDTVISMMLGPDYLNGSIVDLTGGS